MPQILAFNSNPFTPLRINQFNIQYLKPNQSAQIQRKICFKQINSKSNSLIVTQISSSRTTFRQTQTDLFVVALSKSQRADIQTVHVYEVLE